MVEVAPSKEGGCDCDGEGRADVISGKDEAVVSDIQQVFNRIPRPRRKGKVEDEERYDGTSAHVDEGTDKAYCPANHLSSSCSKNNRVSCAFLGGMNFIQILSRVSMKTDML